MVKAHQDEGHGKQLDLLVRGDVRQGLSLHRPRIPHGKEEEGLVQVPESGKPDAVKVARPVWSGGKAARPYLPLLVGHSGICLGRVVPPGLPAHHRRPLPQSALTMFASAVRHSPITDCP